MSIRSKFSIWRRLGLGVGQISVGLVVVHPDLSFQMKRTATVHLSKIAASFEISDPANTFKLIIRNRFSEISNKTQYLSLGRIPAAFCSK
jgi:hypothetical protein